jgi:fatty-acyl-CoA synthase
VTTIQRRLQQAAESDGVGIVLIDRNERETNYSWSDIYTRAAIAAGALSDAGVSAGDHVAIVLPTGIAFFDTFFGALLLGAVPVPLYPPVRLGRLDEYATKTGAMLTSVEAVAVVLDKRVRRVFGLVLAHCSLPIGLLDASTLTVGKPLVYLGTPDELAMIQFSSGTTHRPKPVALTHRAVLSNVDAILGAVLPLCDPAFPPAGVSWLPLYHDMGLIGCIFPALSHGAKLALLPPEAFLLRPALWLRALSRHRAVISPAPNFAYALATGRITDDELVGVDLSAWQFALNGAEAVSPKHLRAFQARFAAWGLAENALCPVYGLAEASLAVTFSSPNLPFTAHYFDRTVLAQGQAVLTEERGSSAVELASVGTALPGFSVEVRGIDGKRVVDGMVGNLWVTGPSLLSGYVNDTPSPVKEGWLDTGDLAFEWDGELYITGRAKDIVVIRGRNHAPQELEMAADEVEGVRQGCSVAVSHIDNDGEELYLFVEVRQTREGQTEEIIKAVLTGTGITPTQVLLLAPGTIPRTSSGKLRRQETLRRAMAGELLAPNKVTPVRLLGAMARSKWAQIKRTPGGRS